ncbi:MAG TPA: roadblock/LC7 domain-containing protein [Longimicrobiales bacterium]
MRRGDLGPLVAALRGPVETFVREAKVRVALLVNGSGQILAQHGLTSSYEVANVASLAAAAHASARALAGLTGAERWTHLHHAGRTRQLFLAPFRTPAEELILVAIFDEDSSLGLVGVFFEQFARTVAALPEFSLRGPEVTAESFEQELEAGLRHVLPPEWLDEG